MRYALEQLFGDQDPDLVSDTIPAVLAWVPGATRRTATQPFVFEVEHTTTASAPPTTTSIELTWDTALLERHDAELTNRTRRLRSGQSAQREHVPELAAYGLAFVAISALMPGRRVIAYRKGLPPDLLFDATPGRLRGVEVAGRSRGGWTALREVEAGTARKPGKRAALIARVDVVEAHLSLWCRSPRTGTLWYVKP